MKKKIFIADLTHTSRGIHASTFPLGTAFVASYAKKTLGDDFDIRLFKMPEQLCDALSREQPTVLACSNYSWNLELGYKISNLAKQRDPNLVVIFGGPNFPVIAPEKIDFLEERSAIDFYIENEGEIAFSNIVQKLVAHDFDVAKFKCSEEFIPNCNYLIDGRLISGPIQRIQDPNEIPSPYLTGILDEFFDLPLAPMLETTRGCPFTCAFCADGLLSKSRITRFDAGRTKEELTYISERIKKIDELIITDLNFGMYDLDRGTAKEIAEIQRKRHWPVVVSGSAGKNRPSQIIDTLSLLKGSWKIGSAMQSSDPEVLKNIKRSNISLDAYKQYLSYGNSISEDAQTFTEIILGLPGDTKEKHFESLRYGVENGATSIRMYQAILLYGTDMASQETRKKFELKTKFRVIPGGIGKYNLYGKEVPVAEIEEIVVGSKDLKFEDYVSCRVMNLIIETYLNNALFEEIFSSAKAVGISAFDCLLWIHKHDDAYSKTMRNIVDQFIEATQFDLYDTREAAEQYILRPEIMNQFIAGELGTNELLVHRALLYLELDDISKVLIQAIMALLPKSVTNKRAVASYFDELRNFTLLRKRKFYEYTHEFSASFHYDFQSISNGGFCVNPSKAERLKKPLHMTFQHTPHQKEHIENSIHLYARTPSGLGRLIQRSNLNKMYRQFKSKVELEELAI